MAAAGTIDRTLAYPMHSNGSQHPRWLNLLKHGASASCLMEKTDGWIFRGAGFAVVNGPRVVYVTFSYCRHSDSNRKHDEEPIEARDSIIECSCGASLKGAEHESWVSAHLR